MKNIVLVFGGESVEHDISILTALGFSRNYMGENRLGSLYISKSGEWFFCAKRINKDMFKQSLPSDFMPVKLFTNDRNLYTKTLFGYKKVFEVDVAINCCHGGAGERGELSFVFENSGIPMSAGTPLGLAMAMNKKTAKTIFVANNIPTTPWLSFNKDVKMSEILSAVQDFGYPVVVKPNSLGSSIGVEKVENSSELVKALDVAFEFDGEVIVERAVEHLREFNCAIIRGGKNVILSSIDEPAGGKIFSFSDKYLNKKPPTKNKTKTSFMSASISEKLEKQIKNLTEKSVRVLDLYGVVRVDFLYDSKRNKLYVNEVNAVPGSLAHFLFKGKTQTMLLEELVKIAENMYSKQVKLKREYITEVLK